MPVTTGQVMPANRESADAMPVALPLQRESQPMKAYIAISLPMRHREQPWSVAVCEVQVSTEYTRLCVPPTDDGVHQCRRERDH